MERGNNGERERDGGFSVHLTVFSLDCFPSALELSYYFS